MHRVRLPPSCPHEGGCCISCIEQQSWPEQWLPAVAEVERAQQAQRAASARCGKAEEQLSQARQAESSAHQRHIHLEHTLGEQVCASSLVQVHVLAALYLPGCRQLPLPTCRIGLAYLHCHSHTQLLTSHTCCDRLWYQPCRCTILARADAHSSHMPLLSMAVTSKNTTCGLSQSCCCTPFLTA